MADITIHTKLVSNSKNSTCGSAKLSDLDFSRWFTDHSFGEFYLHVARNEDGTWHRVFCRRNSKPGLKSIDGELYWTFS